MKNLLIALFVSVLYLDMYQTGENTTVYIELESGYTAVKVIKTVDLESGALEEWVDEIKEMNE